MASVARLVASVTVGAGWSATSSGSNSKTDRQAAATPADLRTVLTEDVVPAEHLGAQYAGNAASTHGSTHSDDNDDQPLRTSAPVVLNALSHPQPASGTGGHQAEGELALTLHFVRPCEVFNMQLLQSSSRTQEIYMDGNYVQTSRADPISDDGDEGHGDLPETWFLSTLELDPVDRVPVSSCTIKLLSRMVPNQVYVASIVVAGRLVPVPGQPEPKPVSKATAAAPAVNQAGGTDQPSAQTIQALIQSLTLETVGGMPDQIQSLRAAIQAAVEAKPAGHQSAAAAAATTGALGSDAAVESLRTIERKVDDLAERLDSRMQRIEACMQYIVGMLAGSAQSRLPPPPSSS